MVYCGKPSKACQRCRDRRLKCDLRPGSCQQCLRAHAICTGYRDIHQLRVRDQTQVVKRRFLPKATQNLEPYSFPVSLEWRARDVFFAHYVTGTSKTWDFLKPYTDESRTPEHLNVCIYAVGLAYLSHQFSSDAALTLARQRYVSALSMLKKTLQSPEQIGKDTTLLTSLLLDIFEKITDEIRSGISWTSHVNGALALVRLRSLEEFQGRPSVQLLMRLTTNLLISCVASELPVPHELCVLRAHIGGYIDEMDPKWQLSDVMVRYANFRHSVLQGHFSTDECLRVALDLDEKLQEIYVNRPLPWQYRSTTLERESERAYNRRFDSYPDRHITQTCNVLRSMRIILSETILQYYSGDSTSLLMVPVSESQISLARDNIRTLADEICGSVPQYVDCSNPIFHSYDVQQQTVSSTYGSDNHAHSPADNLDCYTLIFPLYVCASSKHSPANIRPWVIRQLRHMGSHFGIRNAGMVVDVLQQAPDTSPWSIYAMLGSYAFGA